MDLATRVLGASRKEAILLQHDYIATEHILLGLTRERQGPAASILRNCNVDVDEVRERTHKVVRRGEKAVASEELPYTSRAKKALDYAVVEAGYLDDSHVGTEHLLIGLLREDGGIAAQVLNSSGLTLEHARAELAKLRGIGMA
jgi:ATP-dependent Clp protease ATP-binding subunit ClpC